MNVSFISVTLLKAINLGLAVQLWSMYVIIIIVSTAWDTMFVITIVEIHVHTDVHTYMHTQILMQW